jgi:hypothetical protein
MFEEINFFDLVYGQEYFISGAELDIIYYKGIFEGYSYNCARFNSIEVVYPTKYFYGERAFHYYPRRYYYYFVSIKNKIQQAMESRAINKILKKITGDQHFKWI